MHAIRNTVNRPRGSLIGPRAGLLLLCCACPGVADAQCAPAWSGLDGGLFGDCFALAAADEDGAGPRPRALFVGGPFHTLGGVPAKTIARWDGWAPSAVGPWSNPSLNEFVQALEGHDPTPGSAIPPGLYVGGHFTTTGTVKANNLARWFAPDWLGVGGGIGNGFVLALYVFDEDGGGPAPTALFVGGGFQSAGGVAARSLARWDGQAWSDMGAQLGTGSPNVYAFTEYDDDGPGPRPSALYVGGSFDYAGSVYSPNIARWDGAAWEDLNIGANDSVMSLCVFDEDGLGPGQPALFVGGTFSKVGTPGSLLLAVGLARWDGQQWSTVGAWQHGGAHAMAVFDDDGPGPRKPSLFVGGFWTAIPGNPAAGHVARWDGQQWQALGTGIVGSSIRAMGVFDEDGPGPNPGGLYIGGRFDFAAGIPTQGVARWGCPLPARCDANCTKDFHPVTGAHVLTIADFTCFQTLYLLSDPAADCNEDGGFTIADFSCFQTKFVAGCP